MRESSWVLEPGKFLTSQEASQLMSVAKHQAEFYRKEGKKIAVRDYFIIHLALVTGLREPPTHGFSVRLSRL